MAIFKKYYSKQGLWTLFLMCALPLHLWTFFLAFRDFDWISERTNSWDAVGVIAYGLIFALTESVIVFITAGILGFLISAKWDEKRRIALMSVLVTILSLWSIFNQTYFLRQMPPPDWFISIAIQTGRPLVFLYLLALTAIIISVIVPTYLTLNSDKTIQAIREGTERLSLLMAMYLVFDFGALIIILVRNFRGIIR
ncbi:MAG: hypothetical protein OHK003_20810 [Anaerolineales bacterium]